MKKIYGLIGIVLVVVGFYVAFIRLPTYSHLTVHSRPSLLVPQEKVLYITNLDYAATIQVVVWFRSVTVTIPSGKTVSLSYRDGINPKPGDIVMIRRGWSFYFYQL
jgi:hypothetical protein